MIDKYIYKKICSPFGAKSILLLLVFSFISTFSLIAQETETEKPEKDTRPVKYTFNSSSLIDNESVIIPKKGIFNFNIQHRFGAFNNGYDDFYGLFAPSNIRLGFDYSILDKLNVGFGITKVNKTWDFNLKYALLQQTRAGNIPVSITYYGNAAMDSRDGANFKHGTDRLSFFNQLIIARKFSDSFSVQVAPSLSHFNAALSYTTSDGEDVSLMKNDHFAISVAGRYKVGAAMSIIANYDQPITKHTTYNPHPNISCGIEIATTSHQFQIFIGNYGYILPQMNNVFNQNDFTKGQFLIGFNILKLWKL